MSDRPWDRLTPSGGPESMDAGFDGPLAMFDAAVRRASDHVALRYYGTGWTFAEVDAWSDTTACVLRGLGLRAGDRVAVQLQNVPQFPVLCLAVWKLGGIVVAINPMYRRREVTDLLLDCRPAAFVTHDDTWLATWSDAGGRAALPPSVRSVLTIDPRRHVTGPLPDVLADVLAEVAAEHHPEVDDLDQLVTAHGRCRDCTPFGRTAGDAETTALLVYTSGTTGPPKGAMISHRNHGFASEAYARFFGVAGPGEVVLGFAPFFHVTGLVPVLGSWLFSAATLVLPYRFRADGALDLIAAERVTWTVGAITAFIALLDAPGAATADVSSLRRVLSGGAPIPPAVVEAFRARFGVPVVAGYGMTETAAVSHGVPPRRSPPVDPVTGALTIGIPMYQTEARIVDDRDHDVPVGEAGELLVRSPSVVRGYWERPEESAAALRGGWLHTGDVAVMDDDGWFYLVDRRKDLIVASGYKVWPREVEDVLYRHPAVREAAVIGAPDAYRGETVHAYVSIRAVAGTLRVPDDVLAAELIAHCRADLAAFKVPSRIEILPDLPKTPTGKILRRALRSSPGDRQSPDQAGSGDIIHDRGT